MASSVNWHVYFFKNNDPLPPGSGLGASRFMSFGGKEKVVTVVVVVVVVVAVAVAVAIVVAVEVVTILTEVVSGAKEGPLQKADSRWVAGRPYFKPQAKRIVTWQYVTLSHDNNLKK